MLHPHRHNLRNRVRIMPGIPAAVQLSVVLFLFLPERTPKTDKSAADVSVQEILSFRYGEQRLVGKYASAANAFAVKIVHGSVLLGYGVPFTAVHAACHCGQGRDLKSSASFPARRRISSTLRCTPRKRTSSTARRSDTSPPRIKYSFLQNPHRF